ncbi:hypothetical protein BDV25DRAFT_40453 [Aspergillus avenaceus]|uniref:DUF2293 domain-containing protein n=1 Tax=Aspergillus avenaceus TaxID=36643 RepID=A0A5N6TLX7_ASPAV|nr:hypothetical protein BDV25DRAFT_40453 [Aspergillus avenaceus]
MARVFRRSAPTLTRRMPGRATQKASRKHKVILESVTQKKKKLRSVISFEAKAPPGYTFIPAGNPQLTSACKELCRKDGSKVFAVTTTPHMHTHNLSQHVHRIGYHFPSAIVATVCMDFGLYLTSTGKAMPFQDSSNSKSHQHTNSDVSQITINTEARDVLKDLFPNIPNNDLNQIIKTAFQKGQRKVGTAVELPLARRAQLAVVAHIRHVYTEYDRLLKATSFHEARSLVEESTLAKLVEWRGDDENGKTILEDVFREVIVISDDDDDDENDTEGAMSQYLGRDSSVEIISSHPVASDLKTRPVIYTYPSQLEAHTDISDEEAHPDFCVVRNVPKSTIDRRGFSRYQAWDRAINRYRNRATGTSQRKLMDEPPDLQMPLHTNQQSLQDYFGFDRDLVQPRVMGSHYLSDAPHAASTPQFASTGPGFVKPVLDLTIKSPEPYEGYYPLPRSHQVGAVSGTAPLERATKLQVDNNPLQLGNSPSGPVFVSGPKEALESNREHVGFHRACIPSHGDAVAISQDRALPSIESPLPRDSRPTDSGPPDSLTKKRSEGFSPRCMTPNRFWRAEPPKHTIKMDKVAKRRRVDEYDPVNSREDHCRFAPKYLADAYAGEGFGCPPIAQPAALDSHVCRGYIAPRDLVHYTESQSERVRVPKQYPAALNFHSELIHPQEIEGLRGQSLPRNQSSLVHSWQRSPEKVAMPEFEDAVHMDATSDISYPLRGSNTGEQRVYSQSIYNDCSTRPHDSLPLHDPSWAKSNDLIHLHTEVSHRKNHYADDFIRPVDVRDPVPLEYPSHRCQTREPLTHRPSTELPFHDRNTHEAPGSAVTNVSPTRYTKDARGMPVDHNFALANHSDLRLRESRFLEPLSRVGHYRREFSDALNSSRQTFAPLHHRRELQELAQPIHSRVHPHPSIPEGRHVIIVD